MRARKEILQPDTESNSAFSIVMAAYNAEKQIRISIAGIHVDRVD